MHFVLIFPFFLACFESHVPSFIHPCFYFVGQGTRTSDCPLLEVQLHFSEYFSGASLLHSLTTSFLDFYSGHEEPSSQSSLEYMGMLIVNPLYLFFVE